MPAHRPPHRPSGSLATIRKSISGLTPGCRLISCMEATANQAAILNMLSANSVCQLDGGDVRAVSVAGIIKGGPSSSQVSVCWVRSLGSGVQGLGATQAHATHQNGFKIHKFQCSCATCSTLAHSVAAVAAAAGAKPRPESPATLQLPL